MPIELEADVKVISHKPYRIPDTLQQSVKQAVDKLLAEGKAVPSESAWASPIVPVPKPDGSIRLCVDYWKINAGTSQIQYPIKQLDDILGLVGKAKVLSKLDLQSGFHQIPLEEDSRDFTTFVTPWGKYRFTVMPCGLKMPLPSSNQLWMMSLRLCNICSCLHRRYPDYLRFNGRTPESHHGSHEGSQES